MYGMEGGVVGDDGGYRHSHISLFLFLFLPCVFYGAGPGHPTEHPVAPRLRFRLGGRQSSEASKPSEVGGCLRCARHSSRPLRPEFHKLRKPSPAPTESVTALRNIFAYAWCYSERVSHPFGSCRFCHASWRPRLLHASRQAVVILDVVVEALARGRPCVCWTPGLDIGTPKRANLRSSSRVE